MKQKHWNRTLSGGLIGLFLVGCSLLSVQGSPADQAWSGHEKKVRVQAQTKSEALRPGLSPVMVDRISRTGATIVWRSTWAGHSHVVYGATPRLVPSAADKTTSTPDRRIQLNQLKPQTRYYFQVETQTPLGIARSAVLSFRTR